MKRQKFLWFQIAAAVGAGLAVLLLLETLLTYRYSATRLARAEGLLQAVEEGSALEHQLRRDHVDTVNRLQQILGRIVDDRSDEIAWMSVIDANGQVQASSGRAEPSPVFAPDRIHAVLERGENASVVRDMPQGQLLIALVPLKQQFHPQSNSGAPRDWRMLEIAIYLRGPQGGSASAAPQPFNHRPGVSGSAYGDDHILVPAEGICARKNAREPASTCQNSSTTASAGADLRGRFRVCGPVCACGLGWRRPL